MSLKNEKSCPSNNTNRHVEKEAKKYVRKKKEQAEAEKEG
jgi:hypothetical protein